MKQHSKNKRHFFLHHLGILDRGFMTKLLLLVLAVFLICSALSALYLYVHFDRSLSTEYGAIISTVTEVREGLFLKTLQVNAIFSVLLLMGILALSILHTHRIAGPLYRIKVFARSLSEGRFDRMLRFRKKDAIHAFGDTLNTMADHYRGTLSSLKTDCAVLKADLDEYQSSSGESREQIRQRLLDIDTRIGNQLKSVKK